MFCRALLCRASHWHALLSCVFVEGAGGGITGTTGVTLGLAAVVCRVGGGGQVCYYNPASPACRLRNDIKHVIMFCFGAFWKPLGALLEPSWGSLRAVMGPSQGPSGALGAFLSTELILCSPEAAAPLGSPRAWGRAALGVEKGPRRLNNGFNRGLRRSPNETNKHNLFRSVCCEWSHNNKKDTTPYETT